MIKKIFIFSILVIFIMIGCAGSNQSVNYINSSDLFYANRQDTVITLERSSINSDFPNYRLVIYGHGLVVFEGEKFVKELRRIESMISKDKVNLIIEKFDDIKYFDLVDPSWPKDKMYLIGETDFSEINVSIRINGRFERIYYYTNNEDYFSYSDQIIELSDFIDSVINTDRWIKK